MIFDLLCELAWKSVACAGLTLLLLWATKRRSAAERSWLAHVGLFTTLILPLTVITLPKFETELLEPVTVMSAPAIPPGGSGFDAPPEAPLDPAENGAVAITDIGLREALPWLYGIPAALLGLLLLIAVLRLQRLRARAQVLVQPSWATALAAAQRRLGFKHGTALLVSKELRSPISWGVVRPIILLDERAAADTAQAEAIIAHELAHVARLDWAKLLIGRLATAIFWFNPLVWILAQRCHELCEDAVDDMVLRSDISSADYAGLLIGAARHDNRAILTAANGVAGSGSLTRRVERVLDPYRRRVPPQAGWLAGCCIFAAALAGPLAALGPKQQLQGVASPEPAARTVVASASGKVPRRMGEAEAAPSRREISDEVASSRNEPDAELARGAPNIVLSEALVEAASRGDGEALNQLIGGGVDPNVVVPGDGTPLIAAARGGHLELVKQLLSKGAQVDLAAAGDGNPLIVAAAAGHADIVSLLLDRGANIEASTDGDENALIQASLKGRERIVKLLIARGARVNSRQGVRTPLNVARARGHESIEQLLLAAGARE